MTALAHALATLQGIIEDESLASRRHWIAEWKKRWILEVHCRQCIGDYELRSGDAQGYKDAQKEVLRWDLAREVAKLATVEEFNDETGEILHGRLIVLNAKLPEDPRQGSPGVYCPEYVPKDAVKFERIMKFFTASKTVEELRTVCGMYIFDPAYDRQDILVAIGRIEHERNWQV